MLENHDVLFFKNRTLIPPLFHCKPQKIKHMQQKPATSSLVSNQFDQTTLALYQSLVHTVAPPASASHTNWQISLNLSISETSPRNVYCR